MRQILAIACLFPALSLAYAADPRLVSEGKSSYQANCTACHNGDPKKPGALGPELFGSSMELIKARVLKGEYPQGYKPKRQTRLMTPLPHLKGDIPALH